MMTIYTVLRWWWWWLCCWGDVYVMVIMIVIVFIISIDELIVSYMYLLYMSLWQSVLTFTSIHHSIVEMLSIGPVIIRNGMWWSFSFWRELIPMSRIRWVLFNDDFTYPYHLNLYFVMIPKDDLYVYYVVHYIVSYYYYNS